MFDLVMKKMLFSWWSAPAFSVISVLLWILAIKVFSLDPVWAIFSPGFLAFLGTIVALDMWWTQYLKRKSFVGRFLTWIGL